MMIEEGFGTDNQSKLGQLADALLRNCRVVVSLGVHTEGMTLQQAERRFMKDCKQDRANARQQAARATFDPGYFAYTLGKLQILQLRDDHVFMRTTQGPKRVDVIYRRVDDDFLDPQVFRADSTLGCPGLLGVYRSGNITLANAIGTGVADDKSIYPYVPKMIEFYLGEKPILNNVPTHMCRDPDTLKYVLANLEQLVVKEVHGAGGYGMLVGPAASKAEIADFRAQLLAKPSNFIAQPTLSLSTCPTFVESGIAPRHIDLRPFVLSGSEVQMVPGGLTRVALKQGSLVVNSSQGGGTKDTWVLEK
jgi:uncharacterized circularly permuted ATP-grasp superfamily protein